MTSLECTILYNEKKIYRERLCVVDVPQRPRMHSVCRPHFFLSSDPHGLGQRTHGNARWVRHCSMITPQQAAHKTCGAPLAMGFLWSARMLGETGWGKTTTKRSKKCLHTDLIRSGSMQFLTHPSVQKSLLDTNSASSHTQE